ncbi:MAG: XdhC family protein [Proteobacteria bacterium]|nr:XdhC family protein [Pseudomonadota bacterium]
MKTALLEQLVADRDAKRPVVALTNLDDGETQLVHPDDDSELRELSIQLREAIDQALASDKSVTIDSGAGRIFVHVFNPPLRMIVVGAVHIAQPLSRMAVETGYQVTVVDPRRAFATEDRFPGVDLLSDWPDDALAGLAPDARTAIVTLTHDPKIDDPALTMALGSPAFYIGALGSRKTHGARLTRLSRAGFDDTQLARISGPVGLAIGARSPAEIAVAILAQVTQLLRQPQSPEAPAGQRDPAAEVVGTAA